MMSHTVSGVVVKESQAHSITSQLRSAAFSDGDISLLFPHEVHHSQLEIETNTKAPEGATIGVGAGGALGGALGWLVGLGTIAIPGLGPFIAAGPILAAMSGVAAGAAVGGLAGALVGLGIPEIEAKVYERKLQEGHYLISVRCRTDPEIDQAEDILRTNRAQEISSTRAVVAGT
jgi:hypothetical protein